MSGKRRRERTERQTTIGSRDRWVLVPFLRCVNSHHWLSVMASTSTLLLLGNMMLLTVLVALSAKEYP